MDLSIYILGGAALVLIIPAAVVLLKGMQGPERHLVGDVAERMPRQDVVEVSKTGRRAVGEIVELAELMRHVDRKIEEERLVTDVAAKAGDNLVALYYHGKEDSLVELRTAIERMAEKRSDLSNVNVLAPAGEKTQPKKTDV